jgi:hypothetical protein
MELVKKMELSDGGKLRSLPRAYLNPHYSLEFLLQGHPPRRT